RRPGGRRASAGPATPARPLLHAPRMASPAPLRPPALASRCGAAGASARPPAARARASAAAQLLGRADPDPDGILRTPRRRGGQARDVPGLDHGDLTRRSAKYAEQNNVHPLDDRLINDNNRLFVEGGRKAGYLVEQFPVNVKGCRGSSLCNLGCPNQAKQGTNRVQLQRAERSGVEVVTRAEVLRIEPDRTLRVRVSERSPGAKGAPSEWAPGDYRVQA